MSTAASPAARFGTTMPEATATRTVETTLFSADGSNGRSTRRRTTQFGTYTTARHGVRCTHPVEKRHHIISPRERPDLMYHAGPIEYNGVHLHSQIVGVCSQHHPVTEGEPKENLPRLAELYVPSVWKEIRF